MRRSNCSELGDITFWGVAPVSLSFYFSLAPSYINSLITLFFSAPPLFITHIFRLTPGLPDYLARSQFFTISSLKITLFTTTRIIVLVNIGEVKRRFEIHRRWIVSGMFFLINFIFISVWNGKIARIEHKFLGVHSIVLENCIKITNVTFFPIIKYCFDEINQIIKFQRSRTCLCIFGI